MLGQESDVRSHGIQRQDPLVTVIIPTFNRSALLAQAVESVLAQTYKNLEIIVVDDGSTDNTREALAPYSDRIQYVYQNNRERSAARNSGIIRAAGEYLAFLDSDDLFLPSKLAIQVQLLERLPAVDLVYGNGYLLNEDGTRSSLGNQVVGYRSADRARMGARLLRRNLFLPHCALVRKQALYTVGLFDESLTVCEDWDMWLRLLLKGSVFAYHEDPVAVYRLHRENTSKLRHAAFQPATERIIAKIMIGNLDRGLPARVRQDYRRQHLGLALRSRSAPMILAALCCLLAPEGRLSVYGCLILTEKALHALSKRGKRLGSMCRWVSYFDLMACRLRRARRAHSGRHG